MSDDGARPNYDDDHSGYGQSGYGHGRPGDGSLGNPPGYGYGAGEPQDDAGYGQRPAGQWSGAYQPGHGPGQSSPIPPYQPPSDNAPQWGRPAWGRPPYGQVPYGQGPYVGGVEHPRAQRLRTMAIVAIPLSLFCGIFGLILGVVVLAQVGGVNREIIAQHLGGLDKTRQARGCAIAAVVIGVLVMLGSMSRGMNNYLLTH